MFDVEKALSAEAYSYHKPGRIMKPGGDNAAVPVLMAGQIGYDPLVYIRDIV